MTPASGGPADAGPPPVLRRSLAWIDRTSYGIIALTMGAMATLVSLQVFYRYVLGSSIDFADELSRLFFVWSMFLAIPHGVKYGSHVGIDLVVRALSVRMQDVVFRVVSAAGCVLMLVVFAAAVTATVDKWQELMPTLPVTAAVYYAAVVIAAGHSALHLAVLTVYSRADVGPVTP